MKEIQTVRDFNRFYTNFMGLLYDHMYNSRFSLPEARVLYELSNRQPCTAKDLMEVMVIDKGYLSRILNSFEKQKLISKKRNDADGRSQLLELSTKGNNAFNIINEASATQINTILSKLTKSDLSKVLQCMTDLKRILSTTMR